MKEQIYYFDRLRIIAAFAVVVLHISAGELFNYSIGALQWDLFNILDSATRFAVPVFVMISGALFLNPERRIEIKDIFSKYLLRIAVAFVLFSSFYSIAYFMGDLKIAIKNFVFGHYHMWYLYMISGLYLSVPVLRRITESSILTKYFLFLSVFFTFLIPFISKFSGMHWLSEVCDRTNFSLVFGYQAYFVGGYYLGKSEFKKTQRLAIYILGIVSFVLTVVLTGRFSSVSGKLYDGFYSYFSLTVLLMSVAIFVFAKYNLAKLPSTSVKQKLLTVLSKLSFGIYLVHPYIIERIDCFKVLEFMPWYIGWAGKAVIVFVISGVLTCFLRKIPFLNRIF